MQCKWKIFAVFLCFACLAFASDELTWRDSTWDYRSEDLGGSNTVTAQKIATVSSLILVGYGAAYALVFKKGWWDESGNEFHFQNDFDYALNLDKFGHFAAGVMLGECFYEAYYWAGASEFSSYLFAGLSAMATHVAIDVKDGFAPLWGFSIFDVLSGTLGGFYPMMERYIPVFKYVDLKWSYWINSHAYYNQSKTGVFTDDYVNQTFWASFKPYRMLPESLRHYYPADILSFAEERHIEVIPEIEMSGHNYETRAAYPELACSLPGGGKDPWELCPGKESTFEFLEKVLLEIFDMFPSQYIHSGGDEARKNNWKLCPDCQARMKAEGLKGVEELQSYMIKRMERFAHEHGKRIIGWDEILQGGLAPDATVMSWHGIEAGIQAVREGHDVIFTPTHYYYLDYQQDPAQFRPVGRLVSLEKVYSFEPMASLSSSL